MNDRAYSVAFPLGTDAFEVDREERLEHLATQGRGLRRLAAATVLTLDAEKAQFRRRLARRPSPRPAGTPAPPAGSVSRRAPAGTAPPAPPARTPRPASRTAAPARTPRPASRTAAPARTPRPASRTADPTPDRAATPAPRPAATTPDGIRRPRVRRPEPAESRAATARRPSTRAAEPEPAPKPRRAAAPVTTTELLEARSSGQRRLRQTQEAERIAADEERWEAWASAEPTLCHEGLDILDEDHRLGRLPIRPFGRTSYPEPRTPEHRRPEPPTAGTPPRSPQPVAAPAAPLRARLGAVLDRWADRETAAGERLESLVAPRKRSRRAQPW